MEGFLLIDKPAGMTSHDVIDRLRKITGIRKIGHAGTLDPFATGLLVAGLGKATKRLSGVMHQDKEYEGVAVLSAKSDTQDLTGEITLVPGAEMPDRPALERVFSEFTGTIKQVPPMFSAKKIRGKKMYELARRGETVEREPVEVAVHELSLISYSPPEFSFRVRCGSGTYIRTLAHDIGARLGTGAYLKKLRRTAIGPHRVEQAVRLEDLNKENWEEYLITN